MVMSSSEKKIGRPTSLHASTMIRWRSDPGGAAASRTCAFSISTMTASASSPMAMAMPPSDMMLDDRPRYADPDERQQHGERQHDHHDERRSRVEQEDQADDRDDDRLLDQRVGQGLDGPEDQLRPVVRRDEADTVWKTQRGNLRLERANHLQRIGADAHHHDATDGLAGAVPVGGAAANLRPVAHARDVAEPDGRAARTDRHDALLEILQLLDVAAPAQHVLATGEFEHACAHFRVGIADRSRDVGHREPEAHQPVWVDDDLVLALESTEGGDFRHARRRPGVRDGR